MTDKEYGGYLPMELPLRQELYTGADVMALNSGRYAIVMAAKIGGFTKVYIPLYMCRSVADALERYDISHEFYHIDEEFMPVNLRIGDREAILYANYFGINSYQRNVSVYKKYGNVIFDNTQAFYACPVSDAYNVYSCRKFIGVPDGAYLIHKGIGNADTGMETDISCFRAAFLLKSIELGTNAVYGDNLHNEKALEDVGIKAMSMLTKRILQSADYEEIAGKRSANFNELHTALGKLNRLDLSHYKEIPMVYPLLTDRVDRGCLVDNKIYVPQWWKWILQHSPNAWERYLAEHLLPLPVDQRYGGEDMQQIVDIIMKVMK